MVGIADNLGALLPRVFRIARITIGTHDDEARATSPPSNSPILNPRAGHPRASTNSHTHGGATVEEVRMSLGPT